MPGSEAVHLEPASCWNDDQPTPYRLSLGRGDGTSVVVTADDLRALRDQIDAVLAAPYRVLILGGRAVDEQALAPVLHRRLDMLYRRHPSMEVAGLAGQSGVGEIATQWCTTTHVPVLVYQTVADMVADGGNRAIIIAGQPDSLDMASAATRAHICPDPLHVPTIEAVVR
jgi:hypothetical protein